MGFKLTSKGDWNKTKNFLKKGQKINETVMEVMKRYGDLGVTYLRDDTPKRSGITASSWRYSIVRNGNKLYLNFLNDNVNKGVNIAIIIQYGHGTGWGGYVQGIDYINPALQPVFELLAESAWKEVTA